MKVRASIEFSAFFHIAVIAGASVVSRADLNDDSQSRGFRGLSCGSYRTGCTKSGQWAVDELHSIENTRDKVSLIFLTLKIVGVNTYSFFDSS
jgi:hypothetical protein